MDGAIDGGCSSFVENFISVDPSDLFRVRFSLEGDFRVKLTPHSQYKIIVTI